MHGKLVIQFIYIYTIKYILIIYFSVNSRYNRRPEEREQVVQIVKQQLPHYGEEIKMVNPVCNACGLYYKLHNVSNLF
ncbi:hypothetical protein O3M35_013300 [Rhynocoris fuscipes]|uniref:GATA-type domain-containing protein n=1 Tax=Rhynocoris fuscipes TaxID=488301 RepID=A0AAW1CEP7_9HEMI